MTKKDLKGITLNGKPIDADSPQEIEESEVSKIRKEEINRKPRTHIKQKKWRQGRKKVLSTKIYSKKDIEMEELARRHKDPVTGHLIFHLFSDMDVILTETGIYFKKK